LHLPKRPKQASCCSRCPPHPEIPPNQPTGAPQHRAAEELPLRQHGLQAHAAHRAGAQPAHLRNFALQVGGRRRRPRRLERAQRVSAPARAQTSRRLPSTVHSHTRALALALAH
jgi:hypothetical protein